MSESFHTLALRLHERDTVAVARKHIATATVLTGATAVSVRDVIPAGHKFALVNISAGEPIIKYGQTIGFARGAIQAGQHVHTHNVELKAFGRDYAYGTDVRTLEKYPSAKQRTFQGFNRPGNRAGTRNYLAVISSVNCSASVSKYVAEKFKTAEFKREFPNVDGVVAFTHKSGCALPPDEPLTLLQNTIIGMATHPNITGYVMIGLGCEVNQVQLMIERFNLDKAAPDGTRPEFLTIQSGGGTRKTIAAAETAVRKLLPAANALKRTPQPLSKMVLALNCGGSDGNSGITANPALGFASDELIKHGGTTVLAETPEIYGAEHLLTRRAVTKEVGEKLIDRVHWWEEHAKLHGATIDNNPSPGNKEGGLTTIYEKSLGAVAKAGQSPLVEVYRYAEQVTAHGLCFMDTPGYDPVSMTGLVAGGCNVGVFTTGRGSVYGCKPAPCIKVSTNTPLYQRMEEDMDINAGTILDGVETVEQVGARMFEQIIAVASGVQTKSEELGIGDEEFAPWSIGPIF